jgi:hypothetical protein
MIDNARADVIKTDGPEFREPVYTLKSRKNWSFDSESDAIIAHIVDDIVGQKTAPHLMKRDREKLEKRIKKAMQEA